MLGVYVENDMLVIFPPYFVFFTELRSTNKVMGKKPSNPTTRSHYITADDHQSYHEKLNLTACRLENGLEIGGWPTCDGFDRLTRHS